MREINEAQEGIQLERALKWLLIIPKAVFRQSRRGGKAGKGLVAKRVNCLVKSDWGGLLALLDTDCKQAKEEEKKGRRTQRNEEDKEEVNLEQKRKNAMQLLSNVLISKAVRRIDSFGIGNMEDLKVLEQMKAKYP